MSGEKTAIATGASGVLARVWLVDGFLREGFSIGIGRGGFGFTHGLAIVVYAKGDAVLSAELTEVGRLFSGPDNRMRRPVGEV
jgi:hypothetical protein